MKNQTSKFLFTKLLSTVTKHLYLGAPSVPCLQAMALQVSRDLSVQVLQDVNVTKLAERQQALQAAIQKGEPKSVGVSLYGHQKHPRVADKGPQHVL